MKILIAGSLNAGDSAYREVDSYLAAGHSVTVNTFYLDADADGEMKKLYAGNANVAFCTFDPSLPQQLQQVLVADSEGYDAVIYPPNIEGFTSDIVRAATNPALQHPLKVIGCPNDAVSHLANIFETATKQGVAVVHTEGIHAPTVAEYTLGVILGEARRLNHFYQTTGKNGAWPHQEATIGTHTVAGKTLGVLGGSGKDGAAVIALAKSMGLRVVALGGRSEESAAKIRGLGAEVIPSLDVLLGQSDFLSVNCRKNKETTGLLNQHAFDMMKPGIIIINPAGAEIIDKQALLHELAKEPGERKIATVILDMPYGGRRDKDAFTADPDNDRLRDLGVLFTPRMSGYTIETRTEGVERLAGYVNAILGHANYRGVPVANKELLQAKGISSSIVTLEDSNINRFMADLIELVKEGGEKAIQLRAAGLITQYNEDGSPTTNADTAVTKLIREGLKGKGYHFSFSGEEQPQEKNVNSNVEIIIDGIDGTRNFRDGNFGWCISVAAQRDGETIAGIVHDPKCNETYWAVKSKGAYFSDRHTNNGQFKVPAEHEKDFSFSIGSFRIQGSTALKNQLIEEIKKLGGRQREWGSVALSICAVAKGGLGSFIQGSSKLHDHVAGLLIAKEAGAGIFPSVFKETDEISDIIVAHPQLIEPITNIYSRRIATMPKVGLSPK